ncbi:hypothetical protein EsH8_VII_000948 [Colletotrichum jinshuiense]
MDAKNLDPEEVINVVDVYALSKAFSVMSSFAELRNLIYALAFDRPAGVKIVTKKLASPVRHKSLFAQACVVARHRCVREEDHIAAPLLRSCKAILAEARAMLYANPFVAEDMETAAVWLRDLGPANRACLRRVRVQARRNQNQDSRPGVSSPLGNSDQDRYRSTSTRVAKLLCNAGDLEYLRLGYRYNTTNLSIARPKLRAPPASEWIFAARRIAEALYDDFRPVFSEGLKRGLAPGQLCRLLHVSRVNFSGRLWVERDPRHLSLAEVEAAEAEVVGHLKLLLEKNLKHRLHPRYRKDAVDA